MNEFMWSPVPWVLLLGLYSVLSWRRIRDNPWVRWPRRLLGVFLIIGFVLVAIFVIYARFFFSGIAIHPS